MADISDVLGVRTGSRAFTQAYLSRQIVSTLASILPLPYFMMAMDGNKKGMLGLGVPESGSLLTRVKTARSREKQIFGGESYQPLIHNQLPDENDGKSMMMRDTVSTVGSAGGSGATFQTFINNTSIGTMTLISGGSGYGTDAALAAVGGGGAINGLLGSITLGAGGVITAVSLNSSTSTGFLAPPQIIITSAGTSSDQHFSRPFTKWWERLDPIQVFKKPMRRLKNLMHGASKAEKEQVLADILKTAVDEVREVHLKNIAKEMWGITTTAGLPTSQSAEVFDHLLSAPAAMQTNNVYGGADRTIPSNSWWLGKRQTAHKAANIVDLYNEANYTNSCLDIGLGITLLMCGPSLFPQFVDQVRAAGGIVMENGLPEFGEFGFKQRVLKYQDMWIIYDPMCPDKLRTDPRTQSAYTKNALMGINLDTFTIGFSPEAKFSVDEAFDMTKIGGQDCLISRMRTEMFMICEAPAGNYYWEDVG